MWLLRHEPVVVRCQVRAGLLSWQPVNRRARGKHAKGLPLRFTGKDTRDEAKYNNAASRCDRVHLTVDPRHSNSHFAAYLSTAWLHVRAW